MKCLSFIVFATVFATVAAFGQAPDSEIFLVSLIKDAGTYTVTKGENITKNKGYDNQPSFSLDSSRVYFTSIRNGKDSDIYEYDLLKRSVEKITTSEDSEYTGKDLDQNTITFVREGKGQEMTVWKLDRRTMKEAPAFSEKEPIAYYAFNSKGDALVWIRYAFMIHWINSEKSVNKYVANYAQPSVPHLIPNTDKFSFMQRDPDDELWIKEFDPATQAVRPIIQSKNGNKDYCWMVDGSLLIGSGSELYRFEENKDKNWVKIADLKEFGIKEITRLAASLDGKFLAVVDNQ